MRTHFKLISAAVSGAATLMLAGCGGGDPVAPSALTSLPVTTRVVDGVIKGAQVCIDTNENGVCDLGEVSGTTDADGYVTLDVPIGNTHPLVASVGIDAFDADDGGVNVKVPYTMSAPAYNAGVVSPLTTLVQQAIADGATAPDAEKSLREMTGVSGLFDDYTKPNGDLTAKALASLIVKATQNHTTALAELAKTVVVVGSTNPLDKAVITQSDLAKVIKTRLKEQLPDIVAALALADNNPDKQAKIAVATASSGLTAATLPLLVAATKAAAEPVIAAVPTAVQSISSLNFTSATVYFTRLMTASIEQNTPDSAGNTRYVERRTSTTGSVVAQWGAGATPARNADLHWSGTKWVNCPLNFKNTSGPRDALGTNVYNYCDGAETGESKRTSLDIGGMAMASVYAQLIAAGDTNLTIANAPTVLASATFPAGARLTFQNTTTKTGAFAYYPGSGSLARQFSADVAAGVDSTSGCRGTTFPTSAVATLENLVSSHTGTPCTFTTEGSFDYAGVTYTSGKPNIWSGNSTLNLGTNGSVALNSGKAPSYFSGNTRINVAFQGTGLNPVTYLACQERFTDGSSRSCAVIGTGTYKIDTLDDGRVLTLKNLPAQAAAFPTRVYIERGGFVYAGYQNKPGVFKSARLNTAGGKALLTQLGIAPVDPEVPLALTVASYQGSWDFHDAARPAVPGTNIAIGANGMVVCTDMANATTFACTLTSTNASTGAFTLSTPNGLAAIGSVDFMTGTGSGTFHDPSSTPVNGNFIVQRR